MQRPVEDQSFLQAVALLVLPTLVVVDLVVLLNSQRHPLVSVTTSLTSLRGGQTSPPDRTHLVERLLLSQTPLDQIRALLLEQAHLLLHFQLAPDPVLHQDLLLLVSHQAGMVLFRPLQWDQGQAFQPPLLQCQMAHARHYP